MDLVELCPGATIWLPVQVEGALLSLGDLHVRMGRSEAVGAGLECAGVVTATVRVAKQVEIQGPIIVDSTHIHFVGTHPSDTSEAERIAVRSAWDWLSQDQTLDRPTRFAICASLLNINGGGPAGANVVASFDLDGLRLAGLLSAPWPVRAG